MKLTGFRGIVLAALTLVAPALCVAQGASAKAESSAAQAASARATAVAPSQTADPKYADLVKQGARHYEDANFEKALACYEGALQLAPENPPLRSLIVQTRKNLEYKQQLLQQIPDFDKNKDSILQKKYDKALAFHQAGKKDEARQAFSEVWILGGKYQLTHEYLKAIVNGTAAPAAAGPAPAQLAAADSGAGNEISKEDQIAQALNDAKASAKSGDYAKAVDACNVALKADPENSKARKALLKYQELQQKAQVESEKLAAANAQKAEQEKVQAQAKQNEARIAELLGVGKQNYKDGNYDGSVSSADAVLQLDSANKKAQALKKDAQKAKDDSIAQSQKDKELAAAKEQSDKIAGLLGAAKDSLKSGDTAKAESVCQEVLALDASNKKALKLQVEIAQVKDASKAQQEQEKTAVAEKGQAEKIAGLLGTAKDSLKSGDIAKAESSCQEVLALDASNKKALKMQAEIAQTKDAAKAQQEKEKILAAENEKKQQISDLLAKADAKYDQADYAAALEGYKSVLVADPENKSAKKAQAKAEKKLTVEQDAKQQQVAEASKVAAPAPLKPVAAEPVPAAKPVVTASLENSKNAGKVETVQAQPAVSTTVTLTSLPVKMVVSTPAVAVQTPEPLGRSELSRMMRDADVLYSRKDMLAARSIWEKVLAADPANKSAKTLLEETQPEYNALMQDGVRRKELEAKEKSAMDKMSKPITFSTVDEAGNIKPTPLRQLCNTLAMLTGMDVYPAYGGESMITASFVDKPFQEVLDTVLKPIGLKWTRKGDVITITAELKTRVFNLTQDEVARVQTLIENNTLKHILWGEAGQPPLKETVLRIEDKLGQLFIQDSPQNIKKLEEFLASLQREPKLEIATRIYKIRKESAESTRALVEAVLRTEDNPAVTMERKVFLQDENLIVRGTLEDLRRVEKLLADKNIIGGLENSKLVVQTFVIVPREELEAAPDQAAAFFDNVVEVIEILLYRKDGRAAAKAEGRQMWVERPLKQITVVDYADRITAVSDFINSLPQISQQLKREFIFLKYLKISEDLSEIESMLGLTSSGDAGGGDSANGANTMTFSLRRSQTKTIWNTVRVRLQKVTKNDSDDEDDSCSVIVNTPTDTGQTITLQENGASQTVGSSYQIEALKITPSGTGNDGNARIRITRDPEAAAGTTDAAATAAAAAATPAPIGPEPTYNLRAYDKQNALIVNYTDTSDLMKVREVVEKLDKPEKQVDIETLFVTVNESRAKAFGATFGISDRSDSRNAVGIVDAVTGSSSATRIPRLGDSVANASFGTMTKMDFVLKNVFGYYVNADLAMMESEGVVSMNNGPHLCVKHNAQADFVLNGGSWRYNEFINPQMVRETRDRVRMSFTPFIASNDSIILDDMEVEINDPETMNSALDFASAQQLPNDWLHGTYTDPRIGTSLEGVNQRSNAVQGLFGNTINKRITTSARIKNGGTIVLGGWTGTYTEDLTNGVPGLRNMPWIGKLFFSRNSHANARQNLLIFLSAQIID